MKRLVLLCVALISPAFGLTSTVGWDSNSSGTEIGFSIERADSSAPSSFTVVGLVGTSVVTFTDTLPTPLAAYYLYRVRALAADPASNSAYSNSALLTIPVGESSAPAITLNPTSRSVVAGASTTFTATASGTPTPTWQWYFNGALMPGKTLVSLTLAGVVAGNAGTYYARATNTAGTAQTASATLTVTGSSETPLLAPTITSVK